jgi:hypothetical protein
VDTVRQVDVDENRADLRDSELGHHPLGVVGRPDADTIPLVDPQTNESARQLVGAIAQLRVRPADPLVAGDHRFVAGGGLGNGIEEVANGLADQRPVVCAVCVAQH